MQGTVFSSIISTEAMSWRWFCQKLGEMGSFACNIWHLLTDASLTGAKSLEVLQNAALPSLFIALHLVAVVGIVALGAALFAQPALVAQQGSTAGQHSRVLGAAHLALAPTGLLHACGQQFCSSTCAFPHCILRFVGSSIKKCAQCFETLPKRQIALRVSDSRLRCLFPEEIFLSENEKASEAASLPVSVKVKEERPVASQEASAPSPGPEVQKCPGEQAKPKSKKKPSRYASSSLLMGDCRRGYVREWSHPCTECGRRFRLKINLIIHQRSHAKEGPYECTICEISFTDKKSLVLHQGIHTQERAFAAKVWGNTHPELRMGPRKKLCRSLHGSAQSLAYGTRAGGSWLGQAKEEPSSPYLSQQQMPSTHTRNVVKCNLCNKSLSCPSSLQRHLKTHKPYCCATCKKCFSRQTHLVRHEQIHERQKALENQQPKAEQPAATAGWPQP